MKKVWIALVVASVVILGGLAMIIAPMMLQYQVVQHGKDAPLHFSQAQQQDGYARATYGGITTYVSEQNLYYLQKALTRGSMKAAVFAPKPGDAAITLEFSGGARYVIYGGSDESGGQDVAYIRYTYNGDKYTFKIVGMETLNAVVSFVVPDGAHGENPLADVQG